MSAIAAHRAFLSDILNRQSSRRAEIDPTQTFPDQPIIDHQSLVAKEASELSKGNVINYVSGEETIRNDYAGWYGVSGDFGSSHILGAGENEICEEYPALRRLMDLKSQLVTTHSHPPLYHPLPSSSPADILTSLSPKRFDVILITPTSTWDETSNLPIRQISADPGFVFLWVGQGDSYGLERGRECFAKWGFRRAEDIVWIKTNKRNEDDKGRGTSGGGLFASQKEHCLMGIRGTVRRSTDTRFVHCNVDTDVMVWEDSGEPDQPRFPPHLYTLIENFCLGTRRLELFGSPTRACRGWVTTGLLPLQASKSQSNTVELYDPLTYPSLLPDKSDGRDVLPYHPEVDTLRPKSPLRRGRKQSNPSGPSRPPPRQSMQQQQPGYGMGMQPNFGFVPPQMMNMGYGGMGMGTAMGMGMGMRMGMGMDMMNPAMIGMGFNPQLAYMMHVQGQGHGQSQMMNSGQPGNGMWVGQPGTGMTNGYGGMEEPSGYGGMMGQQGYGGVPGMAQQGYGGGQWGQIDQLGYGYDHMAHQGYGGMGQGGQGYGSTGGQGPNYTNTQDQWHE